MALPIHQVTAQEYADLEAKADYRSEYCDGEVFAMAGGTDVHSALCLAVGREVGNQMLGGGCTAFNSDLRINVRATGLQTYPDMSTAGYDRGKKFENYKLIDSLRRGPAPRYWCLLDSAPHTFLARPWKNRKRAACRRIQPQKLHSS